MLGHYSRSSIPHQHQSMASSSSTTTFSLFFPLHNDTTTDHQCLPPSDAYAFDDDSHSSVTTSPSSPSSYSSVGSAVDCTLSLGMPSSSLRAAAETANKQRPAAASCGGTAVSWDVAAAAGHQSYRCCFQAGGGGGGGGRPCPAAAVNKCAAGHGHGHGHGQGQDPMLVDRRCANCGTSSTPLWRNGPRGPKSLCNACGIRFKKEERRAAATAAAAMEDQQGRCAYFAHYEYEAAAGGRAAAPVSYGGGPDVADAEAVPPPQFLSWRRLDVVPPAAAQAAAAFWPTTLFQYN